MTPRNGSGRPAPGGPEASGPPADPARTKELAPPNGDRTVAAATADTMGTRLMDVIARPLAEARRLARIGREPGHRRAYDESAAARVSGVGVFRDVPSVGPAPLPPSRPDALPIPAPASAVDGAPPAVEAVRPGEEDEEEGARSSWAPAPAPIVDPWEAGLAPGAAQAAVEEVTPPQLLTEQGGVARVGQAVRRRPVATAPDRLLRAPGSVASAADDFFDGLVQRAEEAR